MLMIGWLRLHFRICLAITYQQATHHLLQHRTRSVARLQRYCRQRPSHTDSYTRILHQTPAQQDEPAYLNVKCFILKSSKMTRLCTHVYGCTLVSHLADTRNRSRGQLLTLANEKWRRKFFSIFFIRLTYDLNIQKTDKNHIVLLLPFKPYAI